ncbi:MAG: hypothetical protein MUP15_00125 [Dehalococcoidia bacterium]|nr:hypothetical protein [Dehalococcoidia bacterium]
MGAASPTTTPSDAASPPARPGSLRTLTGPSDPGTKHFFLADQLGSTACPSGSTVLSATATVEQSEKYYPYGGLRSGEES